MSDGPKYPLSWRQKRTPTRQQKRSARWRKIYPGYHFPEATWVVTQGPWRKIKKCGSISYVTVRCAKERGGCDEEYDRILDTLVSKRSTRCQACAHRIQGKKAAARKQAAANAEPEAGPGEAT